MTEDCIVHIIDDDEALRMTLDSLFRSVGMATRLHGSPRAFLDADRPDVPSCLVLDIRLPGMSGLDFQAQLSAMGIAIPVVLMTGHGDIPMTVRGMKAGAVDFLAKPFREQDMLDAVSAGVEKDREQRKQDASASDVRSLFETLTVREKQVMALVTSGLMNKQVAGDLNLSEITVKVHRGSLMRKMGARSLAELVRMAEALKLTPDSLPDRRTA